MSTNDEILTPFDGYKIYGFHQFESGPDAYLESAGDDDAQYWSLYGISANGIAWIADFCCREDAERLYARITGRRYHHNTTTNQEN